MVLAVAIACVLLDGCGTDSGAEPQTPPAPPPPPTMRGLWIGSISPTSVTAGSADLELLVAGTHFDNEGVVRSEVIWSANGEDTALAITRDSDTELRATVPATLVRSAGTAEVRVENLDHVEGTISERSRPLVFVVSGLTPLAAVPTASMRTARSRHTATLLMDGQVLVLGGGASAEVFDPADANFVPTGDMTTSRYGPTATRLANGKVLVAGGYGPDSGAGGGLPLLRSAELYDRGSGTFSTVGSMHEARIGHSATLLADGRVLVAGGIGDAGGGAAISSAEIFDPDTATFSVVDQMKSARADLAAALLPGGEVVMIGGWNGHAPDSLDDPPWDPLFAELFDPSTAQFSVKSTMSTPRDHPTAVTLRGGQVLVIGGFVDGLQNIHDLPNDPAYVETYDGVSNAFTPLETPAIARRHFTSTVLNTGMVFIAGGDNLDRAVDTVELLDPASGGLIYVGRLAMARAYHTATLLNDGRVLVTGGIDADGNDLATAELWDPH